mmetsp:Transcript_16603/g.19348  ORF Transcript_16603/g.19348 Transcript_16603/m.19348 type:complete len:447 (-) Transcript_16603:11-1351(-)
MSDAVPFRIEVPEADIVELKQRLQNTRAPPRFDDSAREKWSYGVDSETLTNALEYWEKEFDWKKAEAELNTFSNYKANVSGLGIHFIHERSSSPDALPLLLIHGWPGSVWEFHKIIPMLTKPDENGQAFHVIAPSLPGYGWSEAPREAGYGVSEAADTFNQLMMELGYDSYVAQAGDWGAMVTKMIGVRYPNNCVGLHLNMPLSAANMEVSLRNTVLLSRMLGSIIAPTLLLEADEISNFDRTFNYLRTDSGYMLTHSTKPNTLGWGLADSPAGLCAWILEKCHSWTDQDLSFDEVLTNISIYWFTKTISSSCRFYYESIAIVPGVKDHYEEINRYCNVPTALALFPKEIIASPRSWAKLCYNLKQYNVMEKGGHFAAWEEPELLNEDVRTFYFKTTNFTELVEEAKTREVDQGLSMFSVFEKDPKGASVVAGIAAWMAYKVASKL